jgi:cation diffusion facilitator CzcD-associated flavoprotein CzcO
MEAAPHHRIAIIGSGFAGLGMAYRLRRAGYEDFVILERADDVGGTWRDNSYPGCQCDVPSHLYSFSWALNPEWSRVNAPQQEIWDYLRQVARDHDLERHIRYHHAVTAAAWDDESKLWRVETASGPITCEVLISGSGGLSDPRLPDVQGLETFAGTAFHSARWNHSHDLRGQRVAVIGTGASAAQFVPAIQPEVEQLTVFQRTTPWVLPSPDREVPALERWLFRRFPATQRLLRSATFWVLEVIVVGLRHPPLMKIGEVLGRWHLRRQVPDRALQAKLTPKFTLGCKRMVFSNMYLATLAEPNVELVTEAIAEVTPTGVVTADGTQRAFDTIIYGTGFLVQDPPLLHVVRGRDGRTIAESATSREAHRGTTLPGFPNLFILVGPNTGGGNNSIVYMIESQVAYVMDALRQMDAHALATVEPTPAAMRAFNDGLQRKLDGTVWTAGGCTSWYLDEHGRNTALWPGFATTFRRMLSRFDLDEYEVTPREAPLPTPVAA